MVRYPALIEWDDDAEAYGVVFPDILTGPAGTLAGLMSSWRNIGPPARGTCHDNNKARTVDRRRPAVRLYSQGVRGELIRGVLCKTMSVGQEHGEIVVKLTIRLGNFVETGKLGRLVASDSGSLAGAQPGHGTGARYSLLLR